jgi:lipoprotein-anchoring transpeptidase ErfK/SrfK
VGGEGRVHDPRRILAAPPSKMLMTVRRALVLLAFGALAAAAPAHAQEPVIADGVTVSGVAVGGKTAAQAKSALDAYFARPVRLRWGGQVVLRLSATRLGAHAFTGRAANAALGASAGAELRLDVVVNRWTLRRWTAGFAGRFGYAPRDSRVLLRSLRPWITKSRPGRRLSRDVSRRRIYYSLLRNDHVIDLAAQVLRPSVTRASFGSVVVIRRESKRLVLYRGMTASGMQTLATFGVATGMAAYPTPIGHFRIVTKQRNPWWYPPSAGWASGASPIPPGPGNPLGTRWMGLSVGAVGIHGTPDAASIGYSASHGCIRMRIRDAEWVFERVRVGTHVFIVRA